MNVDALQPPDLAVAPVAPFEGVHHLADDLVADARQEISAVLRVREDRTHAKLDGRAVELFAFRFLGQAAIELDDDLFVGRCGRANRDGGH